MSGAPSFCVQSSGDLRADRRYLYADAAFKDGDVIAARDLFEQTLECAPNWPPARFGLGKALLTLGDIPAARAAFEAVLATDPVDLLGVGLYLAQMNAGRLHTSSLSDQYIAALFDEYAPRFDAHLTGQLGYCAPALLKGALEEVFATQNRPFRAHHMLDMGAGTGLMALAMAGHVDAVCAVDLSAQMLKKAEEMGLYQRLVCTSLTDFLTHEAPQSYDLAIAADVFCYIADLAPVIAKTRDVLEQEGMFAFTIQSHAGQGTCLGADFRVHHAPAQIEDWLVSSGFRVLISKAVVSRQDGGQPVAGQLYCAQRMD
jgi:predicted TPR repeat methyltransferase